VFDGVDDSGVDCEDEGLDAWVAVGAMGFGRIQSDEDGESSRIQEWKVMRKVLKSPFMIFEGNDLNLQIESSVLPSVPIIVKLWKFSICFLGSQRMPWRCFSMHF